jgi:tetratricopeptide (TPR) repeat protein
LVRFQKNSEIMKIFQATLVLILSTFYYSAGAQNKSASELNDLAWQIKSDKMDSSRMLALQALSIAIEEEDDEQQGRAEKTLGVLFWFQNDLDSALRHYEKALNAFERAGDSLQMANIYNNLGIVLNRQNLKDSALLLYQKSLGLSLKMGDSSAVGRNYLNIGVLYMDLGDNESSIRYSKLAAVFAPINRDVIYSNLAGIQSELYGSDSAIFYYKIAINYVRTDRMKARILLNLGPHFLKIGQADSAAIYLNEGINLLSEKSSYEYAKAVMDQAGLLKYEGRLKESLPKLLEALEIAEMKGYTPIVPDLLHEISSTYAAMKDWGNAYAWNKKFQILNDSLENIDSRKHLATLQEQFEYEQNQRKIGALTQANLEKEVELSEERNARNIILFVAVSLLLIIGVILILYRRREERRRHSLELKKLEIEQRMLRSQMNPHFIFNALNSIQSFITTNNTYEAEVFMSKFSMLVRKILENSTHKTITLEEEVSTLKLYLELEKSRFEERFDFHIEEEADETLPIPPMLLQPFIENAIIHGMKEKIGKGNIYVRFIEEEDFLICEVEDDGVGRKHSSSEKTHKSLATALTNDRISYFNEASDVGEFNLEIVDMKDESGNPSGTKVILKIPLAV